MSKDGSLSRNDRHMADLKDEELHRSPENDPNLDTVISTVLTVRRINTCDRRGEPGLQPQIYPIRESLRDLAGNSSNLRLSPWRSCERSENPMNHRLGTADLTFLGE